MVIKDNGKGVEQLELAHKNQVKNQGSTHKFDWRMASPLDRFAAIIIDYCILLLPFLYLALAPFQRAIKEAAIFDENWQLTLATLLAALSVLSIVIFYQTVCIWIWQCTLGKRLIGLKVRSIWPDQKITFMQSFYRAIYWIVSWLFLGIPFLETFTNIKRRPLHDRLSDTVVTSMREERGVQSPGIHESAVVRGVFWACGLFILFIFCIEFLTSINDIEKKSKLISALEEDEILCAAVSDAQSEWPEAQGKEEDRLTVALTLFASGNIDQSCLEAEVQNLYSAKDESTMLYLARSFVFSQQKDLSDLYLSKICELDEKSDDCRLSRVITAVANNQFIAVDDELSKVSENPPAYVALWGVQQYLMRNEFSKADRFFSWVPKAKALSDYLAPAHTKILWGLKKFEEARGAESTAYAFLGDEAKLNLSSFMCFENIWSDCNQAKSRSCMEFSKITDENETALSSLQTSITFLRKWECDQGESKDYEALMMLPLNDDVKLLAKALSQPGTSGFNDELDNEDSDESFLNEVSRRITERTKDKELLNSLKEEWALARHTLAWEKLGEQLFNKYFEMKEYSACLTISDLLTKDSQKAPKKLIENTILAAVRSGQVERAQGYFKNYVLRYPVSEIIEARSPASSTEWNEILKRFWESVK